MTITSADLKAVRETYELTMQQAADLMGVTKRTWVRWESEGQDISLSRERHMRVLWPHAFDGLPTEER